MGEKKRTLFASTGPSPEPALVHPQVFRPRVALAAAGNIAVKLLVETFSTAASFACGAVRIGRSASIRAVAIVVVISARVAVFWSGPRIDAVVAADESVVMLLFVPDGGSGLEMSLDQRRHLCPQWRCHGRGASCSCRFYFIFLFFPVF